MKEHQLGLEKTPDEYVQHLVEVFREVKRVLRDDGCLWLNLGDCYCGSGTGQKDTGKAVYEELDYGNTGQRVKVNGLKPKDLVGIPWRVAFALQADGWYLRSDIIWSKPNPMPESVRDRPTKSHEYIFLLTKSERYFWDQEAVREPNHESSIQRAKNHLPNAIDNPDYNTKQWQEYKKFPLLANMNPAGRNIRSVWEITTQPYPEAHFATFPEELPRRCIKAGTSQKGCCPKCGAPWERVIEKGSVIEHPDRLNRANDALQFNKGIGDYSEGGSLGRMRISTFNGWQPTCECFGKLVKKWTWVDFGDGRSYKSYLKFEPHGEVPDAIPCTVLDPFAGSGTTGWVARSLGRKAILIELNPIYGKLILERTKSEIPDIMAFDSKEMIIDGVK